ncbi:MAG: histidine phosphatase family protein [Candidatus Schekmanbacteria bacterium]|nr:histidine phosphatase family protein [Candidatus Schekmanbacteria bacterium]
MKKIYLIRHPHVQAADDGICYGSNHVPLSPRGEQQAQKLAEYFNYLPLHLVFASDLTRAAYPAQLIAEGKNIPLYFRPQLREIDCGQWTGLSYEIIQQRYPQDFEKWLVRDKDFCFPQGESFVGFKSRVLDSYQTIVADNGNTNEDSHIAVVAHGGVTRMILMDILQIPFPVAWRIGQDFARINIIEYRSGGGISIRLLNGTC